MMVNKCWSITQCYNIWFEDYLPNYLIKLRFPWILLLRFFEIVFNLMPFKDPWKIYTYSNFTRSSLFPSNLFNQHKAIFMPFFHTCQPTYQDLSASLCVNWVVVVRYRSFNQFKLHSTTAKVIIKSTTE